MSYNSPSIGDLLIATLCCAKNTRRFYSIIREREFNRYNKKSVRVALSKLHTKGYVNNSASGWLITKKGKKYSQDVKPLGYIASPFTENPQPNMIISFDIPEKIGLVLVPYRPAF